VKIFYPRKSTSDVSISVKNVVDEPSSSSSIEKTETQIATVSDVFVALKSQPEISESKTIDHHHDSDEK
jgi:hypothetical protein